MEINRIIKQKRTELQLTQTQLAQRLGVSPSAVNKWEKGSSYPDVTLLAPLARILATDLNELLSFHENLSDEEVHNLLGDLRELLLTKDYPSFLAETERLTQLYPTTDLLLLNIGILLYNFTTFSGEASDELIQRSAQDLLQRAAKSERSDVRDSALQFLFFQRLNNDELTKAEALFAKLPDQLVDKDQLHVRLLQTKNQPPETYPPLEGLLTKQIQKIFFLLNALAQNALTENDLTAFKQYATIYQKTAEVFEWWEYQSEILFFDLAVVTADKEATLKILKHFFATLDQGWDPQQTFLFRHLSAEHAISDSSAVIKQRLLNEMENSSELNFLKDDAAFKQLLKKQQATI